MFNNYTLMLDLECDLPLDFTGTYPESTFRDDALVFVFQLLLWKKSTDSTLIKETELQYDKKYSSREKLIEIFSKLNSKYFYNTNVFDWVLSDEFKDQIIAYVVNLVNKCKVDESFFNKYIFDETKTHSENYYRLNLYKEYFADNLPIIIMRSDRDICLSYELKSIPNNYIIITNNKLEFLYHKIYNILLNKGYNFYFDDFYYIYKENIGLNDYQYNLILDLSNSIFSKDKKDYSILHAFVKKLYKKSSKFLLKIFNNTFIAKTVGQESSFKKDIFENSVTHLVVCRGSYPTYEEKKRYHNVIEFYVNNTISKNTEICFYEQNVSRFSSSEDSVILFENKIINSEIKEGESSIIKTEDIFANKYDLTPENYLITNPLILELKEKYGLVKLSDITYIKRAQPIKMGSKSTVDDEIFTYADEWYINENNHNESNFIDIISPDNLLNYGFTRSGYSYYDHEILNKDKLKKLRLKNYDILLAYKGRVGKIGLYYNEEPDKEVYANQSLLIIRIKENLGSDYAYPLYMHLKSKYGQSFIKENTMNIKGVNQIFTKNIENLLTIEFDETMITQAKEAFYKEIELYEKLHEEEKLIKSQIAEISDNWIK